MSLLARSVRSKCDLVSRDGKASSSKVQGVLPKVRSEPTVRGSKVLRDEKVDFRSSNLLEEKVS